MGRKHHEECLRQMQGESRSLFFLNTEDPLCSLPSGSLQSLPCPTVEIGEKDAEGGGEGGGEGGWEGGRG